MDQDDTRTATAGDKLGWPTWRLAGVVVFGAFAAQLDTSVVNVGLVRIGTELGSGLGQVQWVTNGYLIALGLGLPACAWLGQRMGVGRLWMISLGAFTASSGLCALAPTLGALVALRAVQGVSAGLLVPAGQTILGQAVGPGRLGRVMATLGVAVSMAPALGPVVGGTVLAFASWRWLFVINLPIGAAGLALGARFVPRGDRGAASPLDWPGLAYLSVGLPLLVYALTAAGLRASLASPTTLACLLAGAAALGAYGWRATHHRHPLLDLRLFANPVYAAASAAGAATSAAVFGAAIAFPLYFEVLKHRSSFATGLSLISLGAGTALAVPWAGRLTDRHGGGALAVVGAAVMALTTAPFAFLGAHADVLVVQFLLLVRGAGTGMAAVPAMAVAFAAVRPDQLPDATTQVNIVGRISGAAGGALVAVVVARALPRGAAGGFHAAFWWLDAFSVLALAAALWLWQATARSARPSSPEHRRSQAGAPPAGSDGGPTTNRTTKETSP